MTEAQQSDVNTIWETFCEKLGRERGISPIEFSLARFWMVNDYPLRIVLRAIRETTKAGHTLLYYQRQVDESMARHESPM